MHKIRKARVHLGSRRRRCDVCKVYSVNFLRTCRHAWRGSPPATLPTTAPATTAVSADDEDWCGAGAEGAPAAVATAPLPFVCTPTPK